MNAWQSILPRIRDRCIVGIEYDDETGYLRLVLDDGSVLFVAACYEEVCHVALDERRVVPLDEENRKENRKNRGGEVLMAKALHWNARCQCPGEDG